MIFQINFHPNKFNEENRQAIWTALKAGNPSCTIGGGATGVPIRLDLCTERCWAYHLLADCTVQDVYDYLDLHGLVGCVINFELEDQPALDETAIRPYRGEYEFGRGTVATVDSFVGEGGHLVFKIRIRGNNLQSVFDLYSKIRRREVEPKRSWDEITSKPSA